MRNVTCLVEGCDRPHYTRRICNAHYLRAKRSGTLGEVLGSLPARFCEECGLTLPASASAVTRYCSKRCLNVLYSRENRAERYVAHKVWRDATRDQRLAKTRELRKGRFCVECEAPLSPDFRMRREFCSRACINRRADREQPHQRREIIQRRRALLRAASAPLGVTERDWLRLVARYNNRCAYCLRSAPLTMDHVVPVFRGGRHSIGNVLPACHSCNASKKHLLLADWKHRFLPERISK